MSIARFPDFWPPSRSFLLPDTDSRRHFRESKVQDITAFCVHVLLIIAEKSFTYRPSWRRLSRSSDFSRMFKLLRQVWFVAIMRQCQGYIVHAAINAHARGKYWALDNRGTSRMQLI